MTTSAPSSGPPSATPTGSSARSARSSASRTTATASRRSSCRPRRRRRSRSPSGALPQLVPLPRWEIFQPGEYFRAFERGGIANSTHAARHRQSEPGRGCRPARHPPRQSRPRHRLAHLARRSSTCTRRGSTIRICRSSARTIIPATTAPAAARACHVVYANDRDPLHSGPWAAAGNTGLSQTGDPIDPEEREGPSDPPSVHARRADQPVHELPHAPAEFLREHLPRLHDVGLRDRRRAALAEGAALSRPRRRSAPASTAIPKGRRRAGCGPTSTSSRTSRASTRRRRTRSSPTTTATAGTSWPSSSATARATCSTRTATSCRSTIREKFEKAVHLQDIHLERGMHCADCHFSQDEHGNGQLYGEYGNNIEIECQDCHGTADRVHEPAHLRPGRAAGRHRPAHGHHAVRPAPLRLVNGKLCSARWSTRTWSGKWCRSRTPSRPATRATTSARATPRRSRTAGGGIAHSDAKMTCYACHTSWMTSCSGCHLPQEQNVSSPMQHYEGTDHAQLRVVQPAGHPHRRLHARRERHDQGPHASRRCARRARWCISSTNAQRAAHLHPAAADLRGRLQQPGLQPARAAHRAQPRDAGLRQLPRHRRRTTTTPGWRSCCCRGRTSSTSSAATPTWPTGHEGFEAVAVTEWDEPQAVIGSSLHKIVYPDDYAAHEKRGQASCTVAHHHHARRRARHPAARRVRSSSPTGRAASTSTTSPTSTTRTSPSASSARRSRRSASARS